MQQFILLFIFIPFTAFILSLAFKNSHEKQLSAIAYSSLALQLIGIILFTFYWIYFNCETINVKSFVFYKEANIEIFLCFYFDKITATLAVLGAFITLLVVVFSKYYLHRDEGYKRFFNTVLLFYFGYNLAVFSGNFETLFIGWEFLGITSFLLISFYRDRYLPVKNALKTMSYYRLGDICLILALWTSHHIWHENITFIKLDNVALVTANIHEHYNSVVFLLAMVVAAAAIKSAQFPFSTWLPRAMEGPTTSSAVFYGSLSVHLGVFLLMRTYNYWESISLIKYLVIAIGVITALVATSIARVQSTAKTQIAYSSIAQIGLLFIEVAFGYHILALFHLSGNALLRTYQLLVSPSMLGYMIHDQFFNYAPKEKVKSKSIISTISNNLYLLSIKEFNLDRFLLRLLWYPLKFIGRKLQFFSNKTWIILFAFLFFVGMLLFVFDDHIPANIDQNLHLLFAFFGVMLILLSFAEKKSAINAWFLIIISQFFVVLSIALLNDEYEHIEILLYVVGLAVAAISGTIILHKIKKQENRIDLQDFYGHIQHYPKLAFWFLITCLAFVSLPFSPSFIGIDLMFSHIDHDENVLVALISISFLVLELSVLRIYARLFLGPSKKHTQPIAYRSS